MLKSKNRTVVISLGDPEGIGPEITIKALKKITRNSKESVIVVGDRKLLKGLPTSVSVIDVPYKDPGEGSLLFLQKAVELIKQGIADALVTAPLSKERVAVFSPRFKGHTEYLADAFDCTQVEMMFVAPQARLVIATRHDALKDVPSRISQKSLEGTFQLMQQSLKSIFKIQRPRLAVLGLNPHAGENGLMGDEEARVIIPAMTRAKKNGIRVYGPFAADTFFAYHLTSYDAIIAMYHDQGLIPMKTLFLKELVNVTIGLPFVRTCPAHGTAFDIAGKNKADHGSMLASIQLAFDLIS